MSKAYYTNVVKFGNNILYRGTKNGRRIRLKVKYAPTLFVPSNGDDGWKNLKGENLAPMKFETIKESNDFVKRYDGVTNFKVYGNTGYAYAFIAEEFPGVVEWDIEDLAIDVLDIETGSENGFPNPYEVKEPITAITLTRFGKHPIVFGYGKYKKEGDEIWIQCDNEIDLCQKFLSHWEFDCPDVLTGWNTRYFDIPYLFNRLTVLLGEKEAKRLSPWGQVNSKTTFQRVTGKELVSYDIVGVGHLDYMELYKTFAPAGKSQENYKLGTIANVELGDSKISYDDYDNLFKLLVSSDGIKVPEDKKKEDMELFERWCVVKDNIKARTCGKVKEYYGFEQLSLEYFESLNIDILDEESLLYHQYVAQYSADNACYQIGIRYNIKDDDIIVRLEDKLKLIELALTLAYDSKSNYEDVFTQTRMWDAIIYNYLIERHIVVPPKEMVLKDGAFEGAYVKDPQIGMHKNVASFDLNSLYPHLMMQYSISPENLVDRIQVYNRKQQLIKEIARRKS
jgi:DNA polymerase elongation subunit (family B)